VFHINFDFSLNESKNQKKPHPLAFRDCHWNCLGFRNPVREGLDRTERDAPQRKSRRADQYGSTKSDQIRWDYSFYSICDDRDRNNPALHRDGLSHFLAKRIINHNYGNYNHTSGSDNIPMSG
jgi:hypothetical protein